MPVPGPGYSITMRIAAPPPATAAGELTTAVGQAGGVITAFDVVESTAGQLVVELSANATSAAHADEIAAAVNNLAGCLVRKVSDRTFQVHLGGKIEVTSKVPLRNRDELSRAHTPGLARVSQAIADNPSDARSLTIKRHTTAVVTDGTAVLGLGNIGPAAALPVMEGNAALFEKFAGVDARPACLDTTDTEEIIRTVQLIAPVYGGINLADIAAPRCFEIEARLRELLDIPVFHDDQHGTAVVVVAALRNALRVVGKDITDCRIVVSGVGAAGNAIIRLLLLQRSKDIVAVDIAGIVHRGRAGMDPNLAEVAGVTNAAGLVGTIHDAIAGADVFIGVSAPNVIDGDDVAAMNSGAVVFALANADPEIDPIHSQAHAAVVATGRSDFPNQMNNVLAFPGVFRGLLDAQATEITDEMLVAAAAAIADVVSPDQLNASYIVPSVFDENISHAVSRAVVAASRSRIHPGGGAKESAMQ